MPRDAPKPQEIARTILESSDFVTISMLDGHEEMEELRKFNINPKEDLFFNGNDNSFYVYKDGLWEVLDGNNGASGPLARTIHDALLENFPDVAITDSKIREVNHCMARTIEEIRFIRKPASYLVFKNGTLNLNTLELEPHSRKHYAILGFQFDWDAEEGATPAFDAYLESSIPDEDSRLLLKEAIGYYLTPFDDEPATFYLYGKQRTGKSRIFKFLYELFGPKFSTTFNLQALTTSDHNIASLVGKFVNLQDEDESERISGDKLKALLDHSPIQARRLYEDPFQFRPFTKFLFCANKLPNFKEIEGITRRIHFIHFQHEIPVEAQDKQLHEKLMQEAPRIMRKCLLKFRAVMDRNFEFTSPDASRALMQEFLVSVQPARSFFQEWCEVTEDESLWATNDDIYFAYDLWRDKNGHKLMSSVTFFRLLTSFPGVKNARDMTSRKKNVHLKEGWREMNSRTTREHSPDIKDPYKSIPF